MAPFLSRAVLLLGIVAGLGGPALAQPGDPDPAPAPEAVTGEDLPAEPAPAPDAEPEPLDPLRLLLAEIDRLHDVLDAQRLALAESRLEAAAAVRALQELQQFLRDNETLGRDFEQYRAVKAMAERDARYRRAEAARQRRSAETVHTAARAQAARAERERRQADFDRTRRYREAGLSPLGFDVYLGNMSFHYGGGDGGAPARIDWDFRLGHYVRVYPYAAGPAIDYSSMTISGSVLNAADVVRNIGVAVVFFDEHGSQVGGEIVQVNNARPDVPYPFTTAVAMALDRPFASASTYVLYADPAEAPPENP